MKLRYKAAFSYTCALSVFGEPTRKVPVTFANKFI